MRNFYAFLAGALFGTGLLISGMTNTQRVIGWLDVFGDWDPTLAFVMGGAILPMMGAWAYTKGRRPKLGGDFPAPAAPRLGRSLIVGSVLFGAGWGLAGLCPGPAIASLSFGGTSGLIFVAFMTIGMILAPKLKSRLESL